MLLHVQFISKYKAHIWLLFLHQNPNLSLKILGVVFHRIWKGKESSVALSVRNSVFPVLLSARMPLNGA